MELLLLGSGGVIPPPKPGCDCKVCIEARTKGIPFRRSGCALFVKDADLLFDCPEDIREELNRENIKSVRNIILTHWHPDHTQGLRIMETLNWDFINHKPFFEPINVFISKEQHDLFKKFSCGGFLDFYEKRGSIKINYFEPGKTLKLDKITIRPVLIEKTRGFYFEISDGNKKAVYAPCEYYKVVIDKQTKNVDAFIVHHLYFENKKLGFFSLADEEDSFETMLEHAKQMKAKRIIITHIEEVYQLGHTELQKALKKTYPAYPLEVGFDGMRIKLE